jgi:5-methylcytosine-specific restriction endonuclease McrA
MYNKHMNKIKGNKKVCSKGHSYPIEHHHCKQCEKIRKAVNKERDKPIKAANYQANRDKIIAEKKVYQEINKSHIKAYMKTWRITNAAKCAASTAKYQASKLNATPAWLTKEQLAQIREFYVLAKELQWLSDPTDPLEVDHIVPLQGENVSGLHVPWNLQILPESLNIKKSNKF